jgi:hypothetical protein
LTRATGDQQCQPRCQRQSDLPFHGILLQSRNPSTYRANTPVRRSFKQGQNTPSGQISKPPVTGL